MEDKLILVYVTCSSEEEAKKIAKALLENKLSACVNIYTNVISMYWWEGKIEESKESILFIKTRSSLYEKVKQKILELHSYTCPCIVQLSEIKEGIECFINWLFKETEKS
ncbi:divalent-cation tolerance protein CutA [Thermodesulfobacterium hydrogeniphilum]|uniref:divalent-cation tolerance protein CutA n=1 Tax=Thermodesulfobacterium hydrogeniphilum TaxID=161156 RepID=UPI0005713E0E|nr:divalent-cation tolerance protein CutA [Thermodesulfobacterium hydrogeniphilum]